MLCVIMVAVLLLIVGVAVSIFIVVGVRNASMQKLLKEGEYTDQEKTRSGIRDTVGFAYWGVLTAVYLTWSFLSNHWHISWVVFAVGGVLFPVVMYICNRIADRHKKDYRNFGDPPVC